MSSPDIYHLAAGQAAFMLIESLLLELAARRILSIEDLSEAIQAVIDSKRQLIEDGKEKDVAEHALGLLATLHNSVLAARKEPDGATAADGADKTIG